MRVERIRASTMREALNKIKERLGEDAVVLHSRSVNGDIEVIAAQDSDQPRTGDTWLDEVLKRDEDLRGERKSNELEMNRKNNNVESGITYNRQGQSKQVNQEKGNPEADKFSKWDKLMNETKDKPIHRDLSHMTIEQLEQATQKATEFSELLRDEIKIGQEQHRLWIEHEKQLETGNA